MSKFRLFLLLISALLVNVCVGFGAIKTRAKSFDISSNWAGYVADAGYAKYTGISGAWVVPKIKKSAHFSADATWVGIGGVNSEDLIQSGTETSVDALGQTTYQAWIEMLPKPPVYLPMQISAGDKINVIIKNISGKKWQVQLKNLSTGQEYSKVVNYSSSLSSAEWIEEAPSDQLGIIPLDNFKKVKFTNTAALVNGLVENLSESQAQLVNIGNYAGKVLAKTSSINSSGSGFSVARTAAFSGLNDPRFLTLNKNVWHRVGKRKSL